MKVRHNRKEDILILEVSKASIDHAEESGHIAHFSADDRLVLLEILEASDFLARFDKGDYESRGPRFSRALVNRQVSHPVRRENQKVESSDDFCQSLDSLADASVMRSAESSTPPT